MNILGTILDSFNTNKVETQERLSALNSVINSGYLVDSVFDTYENKLYANVTELPYHLSDAFTTLGKSFGVPVQVTTTWTYTPEPKVETPTYPAFLTTPNGWNGWRVDIREVGTSKLSVIKAVRELTGVGLREAKEFVESEYPTLYTPNGNYEDKCRPVAEALEAAGATVNW